MVSLIISIFAKRQVSRLRITVALDRGHFPNEECLWVKMSQSNDILEQ